MQLRKQQNFEIGYIYLFAGNIDNLLPDFFLDVPGSPSSQAAKKVWKYSKFKQTIFLNGE